jgi:TusE/DsrC/DsvC family sulfur relay protein
MEVKMTEQTIEGKPDTLTINQEVLYEDRQEMIAPLINQQQKRTVAAPRLDEYGFMLYPEKWNKDVARSLAQGEVDGDLAKDHWQIIDYLRRFYFKFRIVPPIRLLERGSGFSLQRIYELFPNGLSTSVCRISGIDREMAMTYSLAGCSRLCYKERMKNRQILRG